jgi:hypothetical protein
MTRLVFVLLGAGCADRNPATQPATELRVPLPDGWVATGSAERLVAGPKGREVVSFESKLDGLPQIADFERAAQSQNATSVQPFEGRGFVGARYGLDGQQAFVAVKAAGARTVWCASLRGATEAEVALAAAVCESIELRDP